MKGLKIGHLRLGLSLLLILPLLHSSSVAAQAVTGGSWTVIVQNGGVSAMHMAVLHTNRVVMFDRTDYGPSQILLPNGKCRNDANDLALKVDCWAHSIELDIATSSIRPLEVLTDTWCSSAAFSSNGTLVHTGGYNDGQQKVRLFNPDCAGGPDTCDWEELSSPRLNAKRWYASNQVLPDASVIVVGGTGVFDYEFLPKANAASSASYALPFLRTTFVTGVQNNLYPFLHLSSDANLFIFANNQSILFNYKSNTVVRTFPDLPSSGGGRNYPSSGSSLILPLQAADKFRKVEVMVCGGSPYAAFPNANAKRFLPALQTCGRMVITDPNPQWAMETMPMPRVMGDMLNLPTGDVLIVNGATQGTAGWGLAADPVLTPVLYSPNAPAGSRFRTLAASTVPRVYHSTAAVLPDGRILVGGSNTHSGYVFTGALPTELRLETYSPWYLDGSNDAIRPTITAISSSVLKLKKSVKLFFSLGGNNAVPALADLKVNIYAPPFTTHSYSMGQRQLFLGIGKLRARKGDFGINVKLPPSTTNSPSGYYYLHLLHKGIPSAARWVRIGP